MTHPVIPQVNALATPIAATLDLEIVGATFQTNQSPPVLRIDVRHRDRDLDLDDCERLSRAIEAELDESGLIGDAYILEISSPGIPDTLTSDREFTSFKGFPVRITAHTPHKGKQEWRGRLNGRDEENVYLNQKGRSVAIPRSVIAAVTLEEATE